MLDAENGELIYQHTMVKNLEREVVDKSRNSVKSKPEKKTLGIGDSNYEGISKGMEGYGFRQCIN